MSVLIFSSKLPTFLAWTKMARRILKRRVNPAPGGLDISKSGFRPLNYTHNFKITYADRRSVAGQAGTATVAIGNISVPDAQFSVIDQAQWVGDGVTDGWIGFPSPLNTRVFRGETRRKTVGRLRRCTTHGSTKRSVRNSWSHVSLQHSSAADTNQDFSIALDRPKFVAGEDVVGSNPANQSLGSITLGGIPSTVPVTQTTVTVPNRNFTLSIDGQNVTAALYYTVGADLFNFPGSNLYNTSAPYTIVDSGPLLVYVPNDVVILYNKQVSPSGTYNARLGAYVVNCTAAAPPFSVTTGGVVFQLDVADLIFPRRGLAPGKCLSSIAPDGSGRNSVFIL